MVFDIFVNPVKITRKKQGAKGAPLFEAKLNRDCAKLVANIFF